MEQLLWNKKPCILYILGSLPHNINDLYKIVLHYINKMEFLKLPCRGHRIYVFNVFSVFIFFITCVQNHNHPPDIWVCTGCLLPHTWKLFLSFFLSFFIICVRELFKLYYCFVNCPAPDSKSSFCINLSFHTVMVLIIDRDVTQTDSMIH